MARSKTGEAIGEIRRTSVQLAALDALLHDAKGKLWLAKNKRRIELHGLPPYSPEFNPAEGVWKATRKFTTHNRFYRTVEERDAALTSTFETFQKQPALIAGHVRRFR